MIVADILFEPFLNLLRKSAKRLNFHLIVILVISEADCRWAFQQLEKDWTSLHDVTNNKIIFVTIDGADHSPISSWNYGCCFKEDVGILHGEYGLIAFSRNCKLLNKLDDPKLNQTSVSQWSQSTDERFVNQHMHGKLRQRGWGDSQSLGVSSILRAVNNVSELQVPCLYFELVYSGHSFVIPISDSSHSNYSFYKNFKKLLIAADDLLVKLKEYSITQSINRNTSKGGKKVTDSVLWLKEFISSKNKLSEDIHNFIVNAIEGKAETKDVYKRIASIRSIIDSHLFNTLRSHLNRITSSPQYIHLVQDDALLTKSHSSCMPFEICIPYVFFLTRMIILLVLVESQ